MAANTSPIFTLTPVVGWSGNLTTGTNTYDGTSGTTLCFTAGTDGAYIQKIVAEAAGTNVASNVRVFINNGSTTGTAANNALFTQMPLPATTAATASATAHIEIPLNIQIPNGYKIYVVLSTTVAAGWNFTAIGGSY